VRVFVFRDLSRKLLPHAFRRASGRNAGISAISDDIKKPWISPQLKTLWKADILINNKTKPLTRLVNTITLMKICLFHVITCMTDYVISSAPDFIISYSKLP